MLFGGSGDMSNGVSWVLLMVFRPFPWERREVAFMHHLSGKPLAVGNRHHGYLRRIPQT